jgi:hypothetical protein
MVDMPISKFASMYLSKFHCIRILSNGSENAVCGTFKMGTPFTQHTRKTRNCRLRDIYGQMVWNLVKFGT